MTKINSTTLSAPDIFASVRSTFERALVAKPMAEDVTAAIRIGIDLAEMYFVTQERIADALEHLAHTQEVALDLERHRR